MTLLTDLRAALAAVVSTATGIGAVHDYLRRTQHEADARALYMSAGRLHTWFVTLATDGPYSERRKPGGCSEATVRFSVHGYFALKDADVSEKAFETIVQAVLTVLRADVVLGLPALVIEAQAPSVEILGHATWVDVLCHYARLDISIRAHLEG